MEKLYTQQLFKHHIIKLTRSILVDAMIPGIIFTSLLFMPLGAALSVIAASIVLAILTNSLITRKTPVKDPSMANFNAAEYNAFFITETKKPQELHTQTNDRCQHLENGPVPNHG